MNTHRFYNKARRASIGTVLLAGVALFTHPLQASASNLMLGTMAGAAVGYSVGSSQNESKHIICTEGLDISYENGKAVTLKTLIVKHNQWRIAAAEDGNEEIFLCEGRYRADTHCRIPVDGLLGFITGKTVKGDEMTLEEGLAALAGPYAAIQSLSTCGSPTGTGLALTYRLDGSKE